MADIDCENTKDPQEISLCACKSSADTYTNLYKIFLTDKRQYRYDVDSYLRWKESYNRWGVSGGVKPERDPENYDKYWLNAQPPVDNSKVPVYNGTCCATIIDNIKSTGGNVTIKDISQSCGNQALPLNSPLLLDKKKDNETSQQSYLILGVVSTCCCSFLTILLILLVFLSK